MSSTAMITLEQCLAQCHQYSVLTFLSWIINPRITCLRVDPGDYSCVPFTYTLLYRVLTLMINHVHHLLCASVRHIHPGDYSCVPFTMCFCTHIDPGDHSCVPFTMCFCTHIDPDDQLCILQVPLCAISTSIWPYISCIRCRWQHHRLHSCLLF